MKIELLPAIREFKKELEASRPEAWKLLQTRGSLSEEALQLFKESFGIPFPDDLICLYREMDGYWPPDYDEAKEIVPSLYLLPFVDSLKQFRESHFGSEHNCKEWVLFSDQGGEILFRKLAAGEWQDETIYIRQLEAGLDDWSIYDGVAEMFQTMAECLQTGVYEGSRSEEEIVIARRHNPRSRYWQHSAKVYGIS